MTSPKICQVHVRKAVCMKAGFMMINAVIGKTPGNIMTLSLND